MRTYFGNQSIKSLLRVANEISVLFMTHMSTSDRNVAYSEAVKKMELLN